MTMCCVRITWNMLPVQYARVTKWYTKWWKSLCILWVYSVYINCSLWWCHADQTRIDLLQKQAYLAEHFSVQWVHIPAPEGSEFWRIAEYADRRKLETHTEPLRVCDSDCCIFPTKGEFEVIWYSKQRLSISAFLLLLLFAS